MKKSAKTAASSGPTLPAQDPRPHQVQPTFLVAALLVLLAIGCAPRQTATKAPASPPSLTEQQLVDLWHRDTSRQLTTLVSSGLDRRSARMSRALSPAVRFRLNKPPLYRLPSFEYFPPLHITTLTSEEVAAALSREGRMGVMYTFGAGTDRLTTESMFPADFRDSFKWPARLAQWEREMVVAGQELAEQTLRTQTPATGKTKEFRLYTRIVRLTSEECLKCHYTSKVGDPVAVLVYGIGDSAPAKPTASPGQLALQGLPNRGSN